MTNESLISSHRPAEASMAPASLTSHVAYMVTLIFAGLIAISLAAASVALASPWMEIAAAIMAGITLYTAVFFRTFRD